MRITLLSSLRSQGSGVRFLVQSPNKCFVPTRAKPRAAQAWRWAAMRLMKHVAIVIAALISADLHARDAHTPLTDKAFAARSADKGVVLIHVNWGRQWNCHGYDNAQLQRLVFQSMPTDGSAPESMELDIPSRLLAKNTFLKYALLVSPGRYALSGFRFKLAASMSDLRIYEPDAKTLLEENNAKAGSFRVAAGEIVYIGHFGVDCNGEPSPWRFYIEGAQDFRQYSDEFHREYPSTRSVPVTYRLFETEVLGTPYALPNAEENNGAAQQSVQPDRREDAAPGKRYVMHQGSTDGCSSPMA